MRTHYRVSVYWADGTYEISLTEEGAYKYTRKRISCLDVTEGFKVVDQYMGKVNGEYNIFKTVERAANGTKRWREDYWKQKKTATALRRQIKNLKEAKV